MGRCGAQRVVRAAQVHVQGPVKHLHVTAEHRELRGDAGVCDYDVQSAELVHRGLHGGVDLGALANIADNGHGLPAGRRRLGELVGLDPGEHKPRPAGVEPLGGGGPDSRGPPR